MKVVYRFLFVTLFIILFEIIFMSEFLISGQNKKFVGGRIILRLSYRDRIKNYLKHNPYKIGMFEGGECPRGLYYCQFIGTDWDGNIYLFDPIDDDLYILKCFDKNGLFKMMWNPIRANCGNKVAVTRDGYIWVGLRWVVDDRLDGLPIVVYRKEKKKPVMNWYYENEIPKSVKDKIHHILNKVGLKWKRWKELPDWDLSSNDWIVLELISTQKNQVYIKLSAPFLGTDGRYLKLLRILLNSDGSQVLDIQLASARNPYYLSPDGKFWIVNSDFDEERWTWNRIWLFEKGKEKGEPLIDRLTNKEPWADKIILGKAYFPIIRFDAKGNIYLIWQRYPQYPLKPLEPRFKVGRKTIVESPRTFGGEQALVVLDGQRRLLTYLPWRLSSVEHIEEWVHPLPDGSGFYRIEYREREAVIYFHPLPR